MCRQRNVTKEVQFYKQLHGTAMGSPVSVVVAEIVMQNIEEQALATYTPTLALLRQRLYRTSEAPLKLLHVYYNLTIYVLRTNR